MEERIQLLFALLRSVLSGEKLTLKQQNISRENLDGLFGISSDHDLAHLIFHALYKNSVIGKSDSCYAAFHQKQIMALYRYQQLNYEFISLCDILEKAEIPFIPLKGSVIRGYYPEPWMRTSCDIDILVRKEDTERAVAVLSDKCGYEYRGKSSHDISLYTPRKMHVELHYNLVEDGLANGASEVLSQVWETSQPCDGNNCRYKMTDEMFYFYHVAHMAKHFENGGCGIRAFIDLWLLDNSECSDCRKREELLEKGDLIRFAKAIQKLSRVWFDGETEDALSQRLGEFIINGGVFGSGENRIAVQQQKKGGKFRYVLSKIFLPFSELKYHYPILQKMPFLAPFMQVRRWLKLVFRGHGKRSLREIEISANVTRAEADGTKQFLQQLGL